MSSPCPLSRTAVRDARGAALVIVLTFIVLLTGLMVAFFARAVTNRQLSNSSAGQTRAALLAKSAADIVIGGFKTEIAAGSTKTTYPGANSSVYNVYTPAVPPTGTPSGTYMVPVRYPNYASGTNPDPIPNLVRESRNGDSSNGVMPTPAVPSFASAVNSSTDTAVGGRNVTAARWNSHYLIPSQSTGTVANSAPDPSVNFKAPDWVLINRTGPTVVTNNAASFTGTNAINNSATANLNYVVGRYAYAVYDEGGLLDMNVAGHPTPATPSASTGFTSTQVSRKGSLALADLTQLPIIKNPTSASDYLSQTFVDQIVGWRNYGSAGLSAPFPNFTFTSVQGANWFKNFVINNTAGFRSIYRDTTGGTGPTDQAFLSRQQLLKLRASLGFSANTLQYLGTFSRGADQPSYIPDVNRPTIVKKNYDTYSTFAETPPQSDPSVVAPNPPRPQFNDIYLGNNDAVGADDSTNANPINTPFLNIRVKAAFPRADVSKTLAVVGEPLVKKKFAMSRLAEVTYNATDSTASVTDPTMTSGNHIKDWFGISRASTAGPWIYSHGGNHILTLTEVAKLSPGREPDFAELLKAAINTGSLGKAGPNLHNNQGNYQYALDVSVDFQILEIMANLIDQYDTDSYPTVIQVSLPSPAGPVTRTARGVEDIPYFYRYHTMGVMTKAPQPQILGTDAVTFYNYSATAANNRGSVVKTIYHCKPNTALSDPGSGTMLFVPGIWNPHDATPTNGTLPGPRPSKFRVVAVTDDPLGQAPWNTWTKAETDGDWYTFIPDLTSPNYLQTPHVPLTEASTALDFSDNNGKLFREPTLLWRPDAPAGANLAAESGSLAGPYTDVNTTASGTPVSYMGICMGVTPLSFSQQISTAYIAADPANTNVNLPQTTFFLFQPYQLFYGAEFPASSNQYQQLTFRLEYADPNDGHWVVYDEKYPDFHQIGHPQIAVNKNDVDHSGGFLWPNSRWANPSPYHGSQMNSFNNVIDPRTARFGVGTSSSTDGTYVLEPSAISSFNTDTNAGNTAFGASKYTIFQTQRPSSAVGQHTLYSNPGMSNDPGRNIQMRWFSGNGYGASNTSGVVSPLEYDGLFAQNNPAVPTVARDAASVPAPIYYEDADGIARRAMAAYADTAINGTASVFGLPETTANTYGSGSLGVGTPNASNLSRPMILNRPFRSVGEMSYAFRGTPWKQLDFFTPESGDVALLDVFCVNEPPVDGMVAGKVNLNTHQTPVLNAILAGTCRDEASNIAGLPGTITYPLAALDTAEAAAIASKLVGITTDTTHAWRGPLANVSQLVGRYVATPGDTSSAAADPDFYNFTETLSNVTYTFAGFSAALSKVNASSTIASAPAMTPKIQRMRESAIRALADSGQTRVWNLLIDVVSQAGRYAPNTSALSQFTVEGEQRCWVHVAIDRLTGEVIDKQVEVITE